MKVKHSDILLKPIPAQEQWLYKNKEALASVKRGLEQKGTIDKGSFAQYISEKTKMYE